MSFRVMVTFPLGEEWQQKDADVELAAGRRSQFSGTNSGTNIDPVRYHQWTESDFDEAVLLKERLQGIEGVTVSLREE